MPDLTGLTEGFVVGAFWEARQGEEEAVAAILSKYLPEARKEPGVRCFTIQRSRSEASKFFFYEVFKDEAAFAAHQETPHFKSLIVAEALPKLAKRERVLYAML